MPGTSTTILRNSHGWSRLHIRTSADVAMFDAVKKPDTSPAVRWSRDDKILDVPMGILLSALPRLRMVWLQSAWIHGDWFQCDQFDAWTRQKCISVETALQTPFVRTFVVPWEVHLSVCSSQFEVLGGPKGGQVDHRMSGSKLSMTHASDG